MLLNNSNKMPIINLYYNAELTLYKEEISDAIQHPVDIYTFDEDFQFNFIDFMNQHKNIWFRNLIDTSCMESFDCVKDLYFTLSRNMLCFTIKIDNIENSEEIFESAVDDESVFYDTWASCPAWGENKLDISPDTFYDIFLVPVEKSIELDDTNENNHKNDVDELIEKWSSNNY